MTREAHISGRTKERNTEQKLYKDRFHVVEEKKNKTKPDILLTMPMDQLKYLILLLGRKG